MKNLQTFQEFVNESSTNLELDGLVNEGALAAKAERELGLYLGEMEPEDKAYEDLYEAIGAALGSDISKVMFVDSETNDEDPLQEKIYTTLENKFRQGPPVETDEFKITNGWGCFHDPKLNVVNLSDYGFEAYYFTKDSKF